MINTVRLRSLLGWLGMLLPWIVFGLSYIDPIYGPQIANVIPVDSISATYFISTCVAPFMIILGAAGLLLISYKGYDRQDDIICTLAGIFGLFVCIFPCYANQPLVGTFAMPADISGMIHNISAAIFFVLLSYNSLFLFTKSSGEMSKKKKARNVIFIVCGIGMTLSLVFMLPFIPFHFFGKTWLIEAIALAFFGISWLTKSNIYPWLFADK